MAWQHNRGSAMPILSAGLRPAGADPCLLCLARARWRRLQAALRALGAGQLVVAPPGSAILGLCGRPPACPARRCRDAAAPPFGPGRAFLAASSGRIRYFFWHGIFLLLNDWGAVNSKLPKPGSGDLSGETRAQQHMSDSAGATAPGCGLVCKMAPRSQGTGIKGACGNRHGPMSPSRLRGLRAWGALSAICAGALV